MQDTFDFNPNSALAAAEQAEASVRFVKDRITEGLSPSDLAWGRQVVLQHTSATGRKNWFTALSQSEELQFSAAAFRVARIKRDGLRLAGLGQPQESIGWINTDPELAVCTRVLSSGFLNDGEFPLLGAA